MQRVLRLLVFLLPPLFCLLPSRSSAVDHQALANRISPDSIRSSVERLVSFETRFAGSDSGSAAATFLLKKLSSFGYVAERDSFELNVSRRINGQDFLLQGEVGVNIIGRKPGARGNRVVIVGGHYDSISLDRSPQDQGIAPGADDNASGVSAVLEIARVLADVDLDADVLFAFWGAEELGLIGSAHFAAAARARGDSIRAMLQIDAIGSRSLDFPNAFTLETVSGYASIAQVVADAARAYTGVFSRNNSGGDLFVTRSGCGCSDHQSFISNGFPGIGIFQYFWNPESHIHTSRDTLGIVDVEFIAEIARASAVATVQLSEPPTIAGDFDNSGTVDFDDFLIFAAVFGFPASTGEIIRFDLDSNGNIGFSDFLIFARNFGKTIQ
jgi:aminopeptidase YwaD